MESLKKLLWIDDEPNILRSYQRALRDEPYEIVFALNGEEAKRAIASHVFQVVISDFRMPGANGLEILKLVQNHDPSIIRVILSGYADETAVNRAIKDGSVSKYLLKPIDNESIKKEIESFFALYAAQKG